MDLRVLEQSEAASCYRVKLDCEGASISSYLTYEIWPTAGDRRDLLVASAKSNEGLLDRLPADVVASVRLVQDLASSSRFRTQAAKSIVNQLRDGAQLGGNVVIAVHKFGAVPVVLTNSLVSLRVMGGHEEVRLAVYPDMRQAPRFQHTPWETPSRLEFVRSLGLRLDRMFQRYFEDIGEYFYDIEHHCDSAAAHNNCRLVEAILGQSVDSKLRVLGRLRSTVGDESALAGATIVVRRRYSQWIDLAAAARNFCYLVLNEYYASEGLVEHSARYRKRFEAQVRALRQLAEQGPADGEGAVIHPLLLELERAAIMVESGSDAPERILRAPFTTTWTRRLAGALAFASHRRRSLQEGIRTVDPRAFLSAHHDLADSEVWRERVRQQFRAHGIGQPRLLHVRENQPGKPVEFLVRNAIGLSDALIAILPSGDALRGGGEPRDYGWILREIEHALLTKKTVLPLFHQRADRGSLDAQLASGIAYLAPLARKARREDVVRQILLNSTVVTLPEGIPVIAAEERVAGAVDGLTNPIEDLQMRMRNDRARALVLAEFAHLPASARAAYLGLFGGKASNYPRTRAQLEAALGPRLGRDSEMDLFGGERKRSVRRGIRARHASGKSETARAVHSLLQGVKRHVLSIEGQEFFLVEKVRASRGGICHYIDGLPSLCRAVLAPNDYGEVADLRRRILGDMRELQVADF